MKLLGVMQARPVPVTTVPLVAPQGAHLRRRLQSIAHWCRSRILPSCRWIAHNSAAPRVRVAVARIVLATVAIGGEEICRGPRSRGR